MITTTDVANIIIAKASEFGILNVYQPGNIPLGEVQSERVVVIAGESQTDKYWNKGFVDVNIDVPDIYKEANLVRLNEIQRLGQTIFDDFVGRFDETTYFYSIYSNYVEADTALKCHFVNIKLLFEILNVK